MTLFIHKGWKSKYYFKKEKKSWIAICNGNTHSSVISPSPNFPVAPDPQTKSSPFSATAAEWVNPELF